MRKASDFIALRVNNFKEVLEVVFAHTNETMHFLFYLSHLLQHPAILLLSDIDFPCQLVLHIIETLKIRSAGLQS